MLYFSNPATAPNAFFDIGFRNHGDNREALT